LTLHGTNPIEALRAKVTEAKARNLRTFDALATAYLAAAENQDVAERQQKAATGS
jgi:hypothetical protein